MINREIPFRPRLEGEFRIRFYNAASEITEKISTLAIARIIKREIEWVENDCQYNIVQRKKYRAVWFLFRDLIRASWKACYRDGVLYMSLPTLDRTDIHDTTSPEVKTLLRNWMSESRHDRLVGYTDFINRMENPGVNKRSIETLIADGEELVYTVIAHAYVSPTEYEAPSMTTGINKVGGDAPMFYMAEKSFTKLYINPTIMNYTFNAGTENLAEVSDEVELFVESYSGQLGFSSSELIKKSMESKAQEKGLLEEAQNKAKETIQTFVESMYSSSDDYKIEIKVAES